MLSCNGLVLNYAVAIYDKSISKIEIVKRIADELPVPPVISYFLYDSWYTSKELIKAFIKKGFYTVAHTEDKSAHIPLWHKMKHQ